MINSAPGIKFGVAFNECFRPLPHPQRQHWRSGKMRPGRNRHRNRRQHAGHFFAIVMRRFVPDQCATKSVQAAYEVCNIFCATANPVQVIVAETEQGRGVLGVIDGSSPKGIETEEDIEKRRGFLRMIGYKR